MQTSITLAQVPYTGFDYGQIYNSLYWVGLLVWSLIIAFIIIKNKQRVARLFSGLAKVFIIERQQRVSASAQSTEPKILEERVVRFDPLIDPHALRQDVQASTMATAHDGNKVSDIQRAQQDDLMHAIDSIKKVTESSKQNLEVAKRVQELVQKELAISRVGQTPDEFGSEDFAMVDFDGVNPDDNWVETPGQKHDSATEHEREKADIMLDKNNESRVMNHAKVTKFKSLDSQLETPIAHTKQDMIQKKDKTYTDSIALDTSSEYPKIILTREEVSNY